MEKSVSDIDQNTILKELKKRLAFEKSYSKVLSSMCTPPLEISRKISAEYAEINLGDPGLFPETKQMELEALNSIAEILQAPMGWTGSITSGGSESNLLGCWTARNWSKKTKGIKNGTLLLPESAHASFEKSIDILNLKSKWIPLTSENKLNLELLKEELNETTVGIVGIAGATGTGACDDIKALSEIAQDSNTYLHVDAAHGGMIFPYLKDIGREAPAFDFQLEGVCSITIDTHKIMGGLIPGGSIIYRSSEFSKTIAKGITYLSDSTTKQITITGTRPGNSVIALWVLLKYYGKEFMIDRVKKSFVLTDYTAEKLRGISSISLTFDPTINIIGFTNTKLSNENLVAKLKEFGWDLSIYSNWTRMVIMPHFSIEMIDKFIKDLENVLKE